MGLLSKLRGHELICLGNPMVDYVARVGSELLERFHFKDKENTAFGVTREYRLILEGMLDHYERYSGGSAANTAAAFANLGGRAAFIGAVAKDGNGRFFVQDLKKAGVETYVKKKKFGETGVAIDLVTENARTMLYDTSSAPVLRAEQIPHRAVSWSSMLHSTGFVIESMYKALHTAMRFAHSNGLIVSLDIGSEKIAKDFPSQINALLQYTYVLFANEDEAKALTGENPFEAANELSKKCHMAVVKCGWEGSIIRKGSERHFIPAVKAEVVNTTGAGDAYDGAFLHAWFRGYSPYECGKMASYYASKVVSNELARLDYYVDTVDALG